MTIQTIRRPRINQCFDISELICIAGMDRCSCLIYSRLKGARIHPGKGMKDRTHLLESVLAADVCQLFRFELLLCRNDIAAGLWPGHTLNGPIPCHLLDHFTRPDSLTPEETKKQGEEIQMTKTDIITHFTSSFYWDLRASH